MGKIKYNTSDSVKKESISKEEIINALKNNVFGNDYEIMDEWQIIYFIMQKFDISKDYAKFYMKKYNLDKPDCIELVKSFIIWIANQNKEFKSFYDMSIENKIDAVVSHFKYSKKRALYFITSYNLFDNEVVEFIFITNMCNKEDLFSKTVDSYKNKTVNKWWVKENAKKPEDISLGALETSGINIFNI